MNDNPFSSGCGFTILRVCVFLPSNMALTIGDENKIGRSRIVSCFVGHRRDEYRHRVRTPRQRGEDLTFQSSSSTSSLDSTLRCDAGTIRATSSRCARHHSRTR